MNKLDYSDLKIQEYLKNHLISLEEKRTVFRLRTHMEVYKENFKHSFTNLECELCHSHSDLQLESLTGCKSAFAINVNKEDYEEIFREEISSNALRELTSAVEGGKI